MCFFICSNIVKNVEKKNGSHNEPIAYFDNLEASAGNLVSEDDSNFQSRNILLNLWSMQIMKNIKNWFGNKYQPIGDAIILSGNQLLGSHRLILGVIKGDE